MEAVAALVTPGGVLADVGTDHGHVPIFLVERGIVPQAIAMDLREGPLSHAKENIEICGLEDKIETRLSDGVAALQPQEADSIVIAGMGGELVVHILSDGKEVCKAAGEVILQPQSELEKVRCYLRENGYIIQQEDIVCEDGKFYPMMRAVQAEFRDSSLTDRDHALHKRKGDIPKKRDAVRKALGDIVCDRYGACLISQGHPVLVDFLGKEHKQLERIRDSLQAQPQSGGICARLKEVAEKIAANEQTQNYMGQRNHI